MEISNGEVHIWYAYDEDINNADLLSEYYNLLNAEERSKWGRFKFDKDRHQYLITRALIRTTLSYYIDEVSPEMWFFDKNEYGKPFVSGYPALKFNISHTEKLIVVAFIKDREIGVDVEYLPRVKRVMDIADSFFSPLEIEQMNDLCEEKREGRFIDLWTLKEAYIKACGKGLFVPLDSFGYAISQLGELDIIFYQEANDLFQYLQFWQIQPTGDHKVSMAIKSYAEEKYSIKMRSIVPLSEIREVSYPITHNRILS